ncbi:MAG: anti-sigma factor family protein, partial [Candidatus Polarisedimenticolia bacterium]
MSACERFESSIEAYVAGGAVADDAERLLAHAASCEACRKVLELHRDLLDLAARAPEPDDADLERVRARVLGELGRAPATVGATAPSAVPG